MNQRLRHDGLMDVVRGYASTMQGQSYAGHYLPSMLYETDGIASVIVDRPAEDAVARGFKIDGDEEETILNEFDRLDASIHLVDGIRWARLHGASAILLLTQDGAPLEEGLDPGRLRQIDDLLVFPGDAVSAESETFDDPRRRDYGQPVRFRITPPRGDGFVVHSSRLIPLSGDPAPRAARIGAGFGIGLGMLNLPWAGRSALDGCYEDLRRYRTGLALAQAVFEKKQQAIYSMAGLTELIATLEGKQFIQEKLALVDSVRNLMNIVTIDAGPGNGQGLGDKYEVRDLSLGGIDTVLDALKVALCASSGLPAAVLFGEEIKGLGSLGTGELNVYFGKVRQIQERVLRPAVERLAGLLWAQSAVPGSEPERWRAEFHPLWAATDAEVADVEVKKATARKIHMEAVAGLIDLQLSSPEEGREMAKLAFPELPEGSPPPQEDLPDDSDESSATGARGAETGG